MDAIENESCFVDFNFIVRKNSVEVAGHFF